MSIRWGKLWVEGGINCLFHHMGYEHLRWRFLDGIEGSLPFLWCFIYQFFSQRLRVDTSPEEKFY